MSDHAHGYSIGETAAASGVTVKAIRYYEEIGLIPPSARRSNGGRSAGHRLFTTADIGRLRFIHHARALGLGLAEVRELVAVAEQEGCPGKRPEYRAILARHLASLNERIARLSDLRATLEDLMDAEAPSEGGGCRWETCGCMDAEAQRPSGKRGRARRSRPRRSNGGEHA